MSSVGEPGWFTKALGELGVRERVGDADHPRILEYFAATNIPKNDLHDETAWCSAFLNWCMEQDGFKGTRKANARSWLPWGQPLSEPRLGCVVVFWRSEPNSAQGHVAFYVGRDEQSIYVLGGNQNNAVSLAAYPRERLLAYRWPTMADRP